MMFFRNQDRRGSRIQWQDITRNTHTNEQLEPWFYICDAVVVLVPNSECDTDTQQTMRKQQTMAEKRELRPVTPTEQLVMEEKM